MKDKYYYVLSDCLSRRQEWIREIEIFFRFRELREKAEKVDEQKTQEYVLKQSYHQSVHGLEYINIFHEHMFFPQKL